jgi:hypothetical protein
MLNLDAETVAAALPTGQLIEALKDAFASAVEWRRLRDRTMKCLFQAEAPAHCC